MTEQIKFDEKYFPEIIDYLNRHEDLHNGVSFYGDGRLYMTNSKKPLSGIILQRCCEDKNKIVISLMNYHPSFDKIKTELENLVKEK